MQTACNKCAVGASRRTSCCAPGDGIEAIGCEGGGSAAMLDAGSMSGGGASCGARAMLELCNAQERASVSTSVHAALRIGLRVLQRQIRLRAEQVLAEKTPPIMLNHSLNALNTYICSEYTHWRCGMGVLRTFADDCSRNTLFFSHTKICMTRC